MARPRIDNPPSSLTGPLGNYLSELARIINSTPNLSWFSGASPNSALTGVVGDIAVNLGSASTSSRLWVKSGSAADAPSMTGWVIVRIAT